IASLASMFIWPVYRVIKNIRQRGRLPDMKAKRVYITLGVFGSLIVAFFFLPLPVSRVHQTGLVSVDPDAVEAGHLAEPARMTALEVGPSERVRRGQVLARFKSEQLEIELGHATAIADEQLQAAEQLDATARDAAREGDEATELQYTAEAKRAREKA